MPRAKSEQEKRAKAVRDLVEEAKERGGITPKTPRELADEAARSARAPAPKKAARRKRPKKTG